MMNGLPESVRRYVPLACWMAVLVAALLICLKIIGYGYLPEDDARRHVARSFANKPYSQIVIMRPEYVVDHSPGWEWLLNVLHRTLGWGEDTLMSFSISSLLILFLCLPLFWMRRPEAWPAAVLALLVAAPSLMHRLTEARPFLLTESLLLAFLLAWSKDEGKKPSALKLVLTSAGFALSVWMHGSWYLWVLLPMAFVMAQRWRDGLWLTACWGGGVVLGALLTGKPIAFLYENVFMVTVIYHEHLPKWTLVNELQPASGDFAVLLVLLLVWLWRQPELKRCPPLLQQPVFCMIVLNWILGFCAARFWVDWGTPAMLVWVALQFDDAMPAISAPDSAKRLFMCGLILAPLCLLSTIDLNRRYTSWSGEQFLDASEPRLKGWLPEPGGIFYADNTQFFYNTFYKYPQADWRYIVGFEPTLMLPDDLKVYRAIHFSDGSDESYEPWIKKMRPADRLVLTRSIRPNMPPLEWIHTGPFWIGRLPGAGGNK